jgi:AcrR family transcriptional regulator
MAKKAALEQFHRDTISAVADRLFMEKGIEKTTMDDIAKEAEYSKATLYVYFKSKDEIFHYITLKGMQLLHDKFTKVLQMDDGAIDQYMSICEVLGEFCEKYPLYFKSMLEPIASDAESRMQSETLEAIYQTGEMLNGDIERLIQKGVEEEVFKKDLPCLTTGMVFWASISGIVSLAGNKQGYISQSMGMSREDFMNYGFKMILQSILSN